jgi:ABC-2 type transport system ATP-binding protein
MGVIEIKNVVKKFGSFVAVDGVSLSIKEGEIFGLLGPNGAGKTTTINMILSLLKPTSGTILINGLDNLRYGEKVKTLLGLMTQETVVEGDLTARENLVLFAELYHVPIDEIQKRVNEALRQADLTDFADKTAGTFSGGMQRRLALVKAMIQEPKILILDEPTTGLDVQNRVSMWGRIKKLNNEGVTIILTTQYLEEADALCDRIAIIDHGKIRAIGTPTELKRMVGTGRVLELIMGDIKMVPDAVDILKNQFKLSCTVKGDKILSVIEEDHSDMLTKITGTMDRKKLVISSVSLHLPTLDDVFVKLTGTGLRDTTGEYTPARSNAFARR